MKESNLHPEDLNDLLNVKQQKIEGLWVLRQDQIRLVGQKSSVRKEHFKSYQKMKSAGFENRTFMRSGFRMVDHLKTFCPVFEWFRLA